MEVEAGPSGGLLGQQLSAEELPKCSLVWSMVFFCICHPSSFGPKFVAWNSHGWKQAVQSVQVTHFGPIFLPLLNEPGTGTEIEKKGWSGVFEKYLCGPPVDA